MNTLRNNFWGYCGEKAYTSSQRRLKIAELIYNASYTCSDNNFVFRVDDKNVCEGIFYISKVLSLKLTVLVIFNCRNYVEPA